MLKFDLKGALLDFQSRTGVKMSYDELSRDTNISSETLKSIATRENYNTTLKVVSIISRSLRVNPIDYFIWDNYE
jgi:hypothetical protein